RRTLYIDPILNFSSYLGETAGEEGRAIATDSSGFVYIAGLAKRTGFPGEASTRLTSGKTDVFLTKMRADTSAVISVSYFGGSDDELVNAITVDSSDNIYL